jgi:hypothetical protein
MEITRSHTVLLGLLLLFGVNGCAQSPVAQTPPGYIAGSISKRLNGEDRSPFRDNWIYLRRVGTKEGIVLSISRNGGADGLPDFKKTDILGTTFRIPLKPGKYEIYGLRFFYQNGKVEKAFYNKNPFSIPVEIEPNRTTYIGAFTAKGIWDENIFGKKIPASGFFELSDERVRDLGFIRSKRPELDAETVDVTLPPIPPELHVFFRPRYGQ